jgi:NNP family nitrate/nitrite transporter-like MFS transporter
MFSPRCVGTANATTAGWGNFGGGATQVVMPLMLSAFLAVGFSPQAGWRLCMVVTGVMCLVMSGLYLRFTKDSPSGPHVRRAASRVGLLQVARDPRVWLLFVAYAACFGTELTMKNIAALYYVDYFPAFRAMDSVTAAKYAGLLAGLFGATNLFARTLGGWLSDRFGRTGSIAGRTRWLFLSLFGCGVALLIFSRMTTLGTALPAMLLLSTCTQMACGATFGVVPFINRDGLGAVSGIVGAGGNLGGVAFAFLFGSSELSWPAGLLILGGIVTASSFLVLGVTMFGTAETADPAAAPVQPVTA